LTLIQTYVLNYNYDQSINFVNWMENQNESLMNIFWEFLVNMLIFTGPKYSKNVFLLENLLLHISTNKIDKKTGILSSNINSDTYISDEMPICLVSTKNNKSHL
jgi:hypothetical protein